MFAVSKHPCNCQVQSLLQLVLLGPQRPVGQGMSDELIEHGSNEEIDFPFSLCTY